ncbi:MAG: hypothetical protein ILA34_01795 [Bacteroidaceae bacterium]|nr:hypothetical protein [Bacteroidaceae bacterium]
MSEFRCGGCQRGLCALGCGKQDKQLNSYDWLADIPGSERLTDLVEVQFKNTRKDYFINSNHIPLKKGDLVAVEAMPGHDVGTVTLTGPLVKLQMAKMHLKNESGPRRVYRIARESDLSKCEEAKALEHETMIKSRQIAKGLGLDMKIGDVEYQGDGSKAIFYYIADQRVDFRQLIKVLADEFHVRIEMRQIGARQEAGRIGGIGPCGRELCCATWIKNFNTVSTAAARCQSVSLNPQKLAGQCAKLKCCLNYEVSTYMDAASQMPSKDITLETKDKVYVQVKTDVMAGLVCYATDKHTLEDAVTITVARAHEVIAMNQRGEKPDGLLDGETVTGRPVVVDLAGQDSLTRFDKSKKNKRRNKNRKENRQGGDPEGKRDRRPRNGQQRKPSAPSAAQD